MGDLADTYVTFSGIGPALATDGEIVGVTGSDTDDYGAFVTGGNGGSVTFVSGGAFDGDDSIKLVPPSAEVGGDAQYVSILRGADIWDGGANDIGTINFRFLFRMAARYIDLASSPKWFSFGVASTLGGDRNDRIASFETYWGPSGGRVICATADEVQEYHNPHITDVYSPDGDDTRKLCIIRNGAADHDNDPPLLGHEWVCIECQIDTRQDRGNPNGRNKIKIWTRDGVVDGASLEIELTYDSGWDFDDQFLSELEGLGWYFNNAGTANANNYIEYSHFVFSANRDKDDFIGPPPGFLDDDPPPDDTTPNAFTFTDRTGVARSSTITSAAITVSGIDAPATISVTGGTYDVNGSGSFTSSSGTVNNGDTVRARHTSSGSYATATNTAVTIGGVSDTFTSTTEAEPEDDVWVDHNLSYLPIVPGAAGFGTNQYGGSGRHLGGSNEAAIFFVDDRGTGESGSFDSGTRIGYGTTKWCANHPEYGHVVWLVNGVFDYTGGGSRNIIVENSYKTFHAHTAPGEIHYRGALWVTNGSHLCFMHLPIWQDLYDDGDNADCTSISGILPTPELVLWANCFHAYGADENSDWFRKMVNGGFWQSVVAWALTNGNHPEGVHNYGMILGDQGEQISLGRTIISHCRARLPLSYSPELSIFNCLMHNWADNATQIAGDSVATDTNIESNLYVWGPDTSVDNAIRPYSSLLPGSRVYLNGNRGVGLDDEDLLQNDAGLTLQSSRISSVFPTGAGVTSIVDRLTFAQLVIDHAGPRPTSRNSRIQTIMDEIINAIEGSGSLGGYPATPSTYGYPSVTEGDVLDPTDPGSFWGGVPCPMDLATRNQVQPSGYTRFEEWSHEIADQFMPAGWAGGGGSGGSDTTPNSFAFTDQTGVARSNMRTSAPITVSDIDAAATITVTGGQYSVNGGAWTSSPGTVENGDTVRARHFSSASYSTATNTTVTIGGVSDTFTSTTEAEIITPAYRWLRVRRR